MSNAINIEELERLANAAGGVKWIACGPSYGEAKPVFLDEVEVDDDEYPEAVCQYPAGSRSDVSDKMAYIAAANPFAILSLLDRLKQAEAERDALAAMLSELEGRDWQDPVAYVDKGTGRPHWCPGALPKNLPHGTKLFARPVAAEAQQAGPARLTDNDVVDLFQTWNTTYGTSHADLIRAVETAVLERNGLKPIPTAVTVAPRGYSWHGDRLQKDELGTLTRKPQAKGD